MYLCLVCPLFFFKEKEDWSSSKIDYYVYLIMVSPVLNSIISLIVLPKAMYFKLKNCKNKKSSKYKTSEENKIEPKKSIKPRLQRNSNSLYRASLPRDYSISVQSNNFMMNKDEEVSFI
mmetsp:Transcript_16673/g.14583  ORF Transcript_16673/g.14583 Transcript_16673/m.14583 type:complete len:119 (-) Transcript_16673:8-364(-)